jgi:methylated-DNA-[protein]-cysteine S-methyltransferase
MSEELLQERALRDAAASLTMSPPPLEAAAASAGLLDVAYATLDSALGTLLLASTPRGLVRLAYVDDGEDEILAHLAAMISPRVLSSPRKLDESRRELDEYLAGRRRSFDIAVDWSLSDGFRRRVLEATARIPYGTVSTYGRIAADAGSPGGSRAAGNALGANPLPIVVPCHRVVRAGGSLGGYTGGVERKRLLLDVEGGAPQA